MAKLTIVAPFKVGGKQYDYEAVYAALKTKLNGKTIEVALEDKHLYADDVVALPTDKLEEKVADAFHKKFGQAAKNIKADLLKVDGLTKKTALGAAKASLHFTNSDLKDIEFKVELKGPQNSDPEKRAKRRGEKEEVAYEYDLLGLDVESQLLAKIKDLTTLGPDGRHGAKETVGGVSVHHHTIPRANMTVFYDWDGDTLKVRGVGGHSGKDGSNDQYDVTWHTGRRFTWSR